ncbi:SdpI family protein [Flavobacterium johnsoniae]|uniref:SdpI family protein n=1 Tax=Flavobacterium johnsoniae TaxID=986 RepID=UPI0025B27323|nr:SdpI family protein [Flavobacterium johnsoniae]WJS95349.1 SdpI family protein [Flavobacterium johnsoniae]
MEILTLLSKNPIVIIVLFIMLITKVFPPKNINSLYGYRTSNSMKNKLNWDFAQKYSTNLFLKILSLLLLVQIILYAIFGSTSFADFSVFIGLIISVAFVLYQTEKKLKKQENLQV